MVQSDSSLGKGPINWTITMHSEPEKVSDLAIDVGLLPGHMYQILVEAKLFGGPDFEYWEGEVIGVMCHSRCTAKTCPHIADRVVARMGASWVDESDLR